MSIKRPSSPSRPSKPKTFGTSASVQMSREHAMELRGANAPGLSFQSRISRQLYWIQRLRDTALEAQQSEQQDVAILAATDIRGETTIESAEVESATMESSPPTPPTGMPADYGEPTTGEEQQAEEAAGGR